MNIFSVIPIHQKVVIRLPMLAVPCHTLQRPQTEGSFKFQSQRHMTFALTFFAATSSVDLYRASLTALEERKKVTKKKGHLKGSLVFDNNQHAPQPTKPIRLDTLA